MIENFIRQEEPPAGGIFLSGDCAILNQAESLRQANGAFAYAYCFWLNNRDLLPRDVGKVIAINELPDGELCTQDFHEATNVSLYFDAQKKIEDLYTWRIKRKDSATNFRTIDQITVSPKRVSCDRTILNDWRRPIKVKPLEPSILIGQVIKIAEHEITKKHIIEKRQRLEEAREQLSKFALEAAQNPTHNSYWCADAPNYKAELDKRREEIYGVTFSQQTGSTS